MARAFLIGASDMADLDFRPDVAGNPANHAASVTPADGANLVVTSRAIYIGGEGDIRVIMRGGQAVTFTGVPAGTLLPIRAARVTSTGTTATNIISLW